MGTYRVGERTELSEPDRLILQLPITAGPLDGGIMTVDADFRPHGGWKYIVPGRTVLVRSYRDLLDVIRHDLAVHAPGGSNDETWYYVAIYHCSRLERPGPDTQVTLTWSPNLT